MTYTDLFPAPKHSFDRLRNAFAALLMEATEPISKLVSSKAKPIFHLVVSSLTWGLILRVAGPVSPRWLTGCLIAVGATMVFASVTESRKAEATDDGTGLNLEVASALPAMLCGMTAVMATPIAYGDLSAMSVVLMLAATLMMWFDLTMLCFTGGPGLMDKIRERQVERTPNFGMNGTA